MNITLNSKFKSFVTQAMRYKIAYGGRGSGKSWTVARILLLKAMSQPLRILCTREIQDSIKDSVHKLLNDQIALLGLVGFTVQNDSIKHENGSEILFKGLYTNLSKIKSFEGVDICWIEEAESISAMSWEILDPTIRKPNSEIWITFNPRYENDIIYKTFIVNTVKNAIVVKVNHYDNKYFPAELKKQMEAMAKNDPDLFLHIWEGELKKNTSDLIFNNKWVIEEFKESTPALNHPLFGADWGFSNDPNTLIRSFIGSHKDYGDNCLFIEYEANDRPYNEDTRNTSTSIENLPALWDKIPLSRRYQIIADSARPETIEYMNNRGFSVAGATKGKGSVVDGIEFIRSFDKVIIHPRCVNTIFEFGNYKFKIDIKSGQITSQIVDKYNHQIDALRYSLESVMHNRIIDYSKII